ncbi:hypothetical protein QJS66_03645 [Kocuria rhizophila]|nr:hypothetical protein QJS66_03645 [Kocuria rhizophila]
MHVVRCCGRPRGRGACRRRPVHGHRRGAPRARARRGSPDRAGRALTGVVEDGVGHWSLNCPRSRRRIRPSRWRLPWCRLGLLVPQLRQRDELTLLAL